MEKFSADFPADRSLSFLTQSEIGLAEAFLSDGHLVRPAEDRAGLDRIRARAAELAAAHLGIATPADAGQFLDTIHAHVDVDGLNAMRLAVFNGLNAEAWFRPTYFALARSLLDNLVGNELCMQRRVNLSVQMPGDESSLLPVHADVWDGDSPFEVVLWVPLVDCHGTKAMYLMAPGKDRPVQAELAKFDGKSAEDIYAAIADDVRFIKVAYGEVLVFSQTLMHGNRINRETETRWSMNCRFKSIMSPYADKKLGEFFEPITMRAATRLGLDYKLPEGFRG
jgi:sporadic carbohydrate cluster 2OG-Fe(II) oxygenase